jgi:hypothetical protein
MRTSQDWGQSCPHLHMQDCLSVDYVKPIILTISAIPCDSGGPQLFKPGAKP